MQQTGTRAAMHPARRRIAGAGALGLLALVALASGCGGGNTEKESDATVPTLQISSDVLGTATGVFTVRFSFSAAVSGFGTSGIELSNGFASTGLSKLSETVYTLQVTPAANFSGVCEVRVKVGAFEDASVSVGNTVAYNHGQPVDTVVGAGEPTLTISHNVGGATATGPVTLTFTFSADVSGSFGAGDIQLTAGALGSFTSNAGGMLYTAVVNLPTATTGDLGVVVPAGSFQTLAGVANQKAYSKLLPFAVPA